MTIKHMKSNNKNRILFTAKNDNLLKNNIASI